MSIGKRIKKRRELLNLSQDQLALKIGYSSRSSINKIENDERNLPQSKIIDIARALDTTPSYIMGWNQEYIDNTDSYIPVLSKAYFNQDINIEAQAIGYERINEKMSSLGTFYALKMADSSMEPLIHEDSIMIIHESNKMENGDVCVVTIKDQAAIIRKVEVNESGEIVTLIPLNSDYKTEVYTKKEVNELPLSVIGVVVETRTQIKPLNRLNRKYTKGND